MADEHAILTGCLLVDIVASTSSTVNLNSEQYQKYMDGLLTALDPHLSPLGLEGTTVQFQGDGWLIFVDDSSKFAALACLALALIHLLPQRLGVDGVKASASTGRDFRKHVGSGVTHVGDSARRARRIEQLCGPGQFLASEAFIDDLKRDFDVSKMEVPHQPPKWEEEITVWCVSGPRIDADTRIPEFIYLLKMLGNADSAAKVQERFLETPEGISVVLGDRILAAQTDEQDAVGVIFRVPVLRSRTRSWNIALSKSRDFDAARGVLDEMRRKGVAPDVVTFNTLMNLAPTYDEAQNVLEGMAEAGVAPDVVTFSTLMNLAPTYDEAQNVLEGMAEAGVAPNVVTFNTLMNLAPTYDEAQNVLEGMAEAGVAPDVVTFSTVAKKVESDLPPGDFLRWLWDKVPMGCRPGCADAAVAKYVKVEALDFALTIAYHYPGIGSAKKLMRREPDVAAEFFARRNEALAGGRDDQGLIALAELHIQTKRSPEAVAYYQQALELAEGEPRRKWIGSQIDKLRNIAGDPARE